MLASDSMHEPPRELPPGSVSINDLKATAEDGFVPQDQILDYERNKRNKMKQAQQDRFLEALRVANAADDARLAKQKKNKPTYGR